MTDPGCIVRLEAVSKRFGSVTAVDAIDLTVEKGEFLALLGPSGCGKTTTLRMIAGFEQPTSGRVVVAGELMNDVPPHRRPVNTVFQSYALFPHLTVVDNVAFGLRQRGVGRRERRVRAVEALEMVRLADKARSRPDHLSGGQRQRVALARALVLRPEVLLLDEPLSALDQQLRRGMQIELKRLHEELGLTFVFVTHDQHEAMAMADRIVVMDRGRIAQLGAASELYDAPVDRFVAEFIGDLSRLSGVVSGSEVVIGRGDRVPVGRSLVDVEDGARVLLGLRPEAVRLTAGPGALSGTVVTTMVLGDAIQVVVALPNGEQVISRQSREARPPESFARTGDRVGLAVDAGAGLVIARLDDEVPTPAHQPVPVGAEAI